MFDIHLWYVHVYKYGTITIYENFPPDPKLCVLRASYALRISHKMTYTIHMLYLLYCTWPFKEAYILVWHMTTKAGLAHSITESFRPEGQIIIAVYLFVGTERTYNTLGKHSHIALVAGLCMGSVSNDCIWITWNIPRFKPGYWLYNWHILSVVFCFVFFSMCSLYYN